MSSHSLPYSLDSRRRRAIATPGKQGALFHREQLGLHLRQLHWASEAASVSHGQGPAFSPPSQPAGSPPRCRPAPPLPAAGSGAASTSLIPNLALIYLCVHGRGSALARGLARWVFHRLQQLWHPPGPHHPLACPSESFAHAGWIRVARESSPGIARPKRISLMVAPFPPPAGVPFLDVMATMSNNTTPASC